MNNNFASLLVGIGMAMATCTAQAAVIGHDAIDRANSDGYGNFVLALSGSSFPSSGSISGWHVYAANGGTLGLLILSGADSAPTVQASFQQTVTAGLNDFSLAATVSGGQYLGIWIGSAKVDFDLTSESLTYSSNAAYSTLPAFGTTIAIEGRTSRDYSINVDFTATPVPEPSGVALVAVALLGLGFARRKQAQG